MRELGAVDNQYSIPSASRCKVRCLIREWCLIRVGPVNYRHITGKDSAVNSAGGTLRAHVRSTAFQSAEGVDSPVITHDAHAFALSVKRESAKLHVLKIPLEPFS